MSRALIVDDEASICWAFREFLTDEGHEVDIASSAEEGLRLAETKAHDVVVLDVRLPGMDGLSAIPKFRRRLGPVPIVVITAFGNLDTAVRAVEGGAFDYLVKPFDLDQASSVVQRALEQRTAREGSPVSSEAANAEALIGTSPANAEALIGTSPAMQELFKSIALVAPADVPVLITGESGTGKELVARAIHRHSRRKDGPFLPVCPAALSPTLVEREFFGHVKGAFTGAIQDHKGLLELASSGTVLLDEIGDVAPSIQVKLLRAIEHREIMAVGDARPRPTDIRVLAATNRPLNELMASGQFREDLFFRLSVFQIHLPPLRDRREDIPALAEHFLRQAHLPRAGELHLGRDVLDELAARSWVGNVRELRNAIERAAIVARGQAIRPEHLPPALSHQTPTAPDEIGSQLSHWARQEAARFLDHPSEAALYERFLDLTEPHVLRAVLSACGDNRARTAEMLGIHRATLRSKMAQHAIG